MTKLAQGDLAPDFTLPRDGGGTLKLSDLRGNAVVLFFYPRDDTSGCTAEAIAFSGLKDAFERQSAVIVGMSADSQKSHDKFKAKHNLAVDLVADEEKQALEAYGVWAEKSMYGRKFMGIVRTTFLIDASGKIAKVWPNVKVPGHADAVLEAVKALPAS